LLVEVPLPVRFRFGCFELQPTERRLLDDGRPVALGARAFDLLLALIERRDRLVGKSELLDLVWPGLVVEEANLPVQVSGLRKLIGPQAIATVPGRGYRFAMAVADDAPTAPVELVSSEEPIARTNVPAAIGALLGRDTDTEALAQWLAEHRLVTVLGAGGIGKTRLAQAVARAAVCQFSDGVWWVDVAALSSADRVAPGIASAARVQLADGEGLAPLVRTLARRQMLLVLDNCEHLAAEIALIVSAVLAGAAGVRVLTTSQEALKTEGEHLYMLSALAVPPVGVSLATARGFAAVQLLEQRAFAADRRFTLTEATVGLAIDLCRQLDGVALAIEMAAARLPLLGLAGLHQRLGDRLNLLRANSREAPSRQRTLRATLDWSHDLLDANERVVLRRLAVFVGSFRLDAAQQTTAFAGLDSAAVLDALAGLVEKSLVRLEQFEPPRYRLAESTRLYAWEHLRNAGEVESAFRCHDDAVARFAAEIERSPLPGSCLLQHFALDYDDAREAFDRAIKHQNPDLASTTVLFLRSIDHLRGDLSAACDRVRAIDTLPTTDNLAAQARLMFFVAACSWYRGRHARIDAARESVRLWRLLGDDWELYRSLCILAVQSAEIGEFQEAQQALDETTYLENRSWPARWRADGARCASMVAESRGDTAAQIRLSMEAASLYEQAGVRTVAALMRLVLADATLQAGGTRDAIAICQATVDELREFGSQSFMAVGLAMLCKFWLFAEQPDLARAAAVEAFPIFDQIGALDELVDSFALLAAMNGRIHGAALLLGYADACQRLDPFPRACKVAEHIAGRTEAAILIAVGPAECGRLRAEGALMSEHAAVLLLRKVLTDQSTELMELPGGLKAEVQHPLGNC
jgi:predicted ATPase/DNA-binding winged helix-turn-helix (wHTH) protein